MNSGFEVSSSPFDWIVKETKIQEAVGGGEIIQAGVEGWVLVCVCVSGSCCRGGCTLRLAEHGASNAPLTSQVDPLE